MHHYGGKRTRSADEVICFAFLCCGIEVLMVPLERIRVH